MSKLQKCDEPKIGQKISTRGPPTEISDGSMILVIIYRLVKIVGKGPSDRDFLAYFWFVPILEFGHLVHKGLKTFRKTSQSIDSMSPKKNIVLDFLIVSADTEDLLPEYCNFRRENSRSNSLLCTGAVSMYLTTFAKSGF